MAENQISVTDEQFQPLNSGNSFSAKRIDSPLGVVRLLTMPSMEQACELWSRLHQTQSKHLPFIVPTAYPFIEPTIRWLTEELPQRDLARFKEEIRNFDPSQFVASQPQSRWQEQEYPYNMHQGSYQMDWWTGPASTRPGWLESAVTPLKANPNNLPPYKTPFQDIHALAKSFTPNRRQAGRMAYHLLLFDGPLELMPLCLETLIRMDEPCPSATQWGGLWKHWHQKFGVLPLMLHTSLQLLPKKRPADFDEAMNLTLELRSCSQNVPDTLSNALHMVLEAPLWTLWWD